MRIALGKMLPRKEPVATRVEVWFNHDDRLWTVQCKDDQGNQVGDAEYAHHKRDAVSYAERHNLPVTTRTKKEC